MSKQPPTPAPPSPPAVQTPISLLNTHIHLYPQEHLPNLAWCHPSHPFWSSHTLHEYARATTHPAALAALSDQFPTIPLPSSWTSTSTSTSASESAPQQSPSQASSQTKIKLQLDGCVFIETDRETHSTSEAAWRAGPLNEIRFVASLMVPSTAAATPATSPSETLSAPLPPPLPALKAFIPWAPLASQPAPATLARYLSLAEEACASTSFTSTTISTAFPTSSASISPPPSSLSNPHTHTHPSPSGFRFLTQDKLRSTMTSSIFLSNLSYLFSSHSHPQAAIPPSLVFELGIDVHNGGSWQIDEAVEMLWLLEVSGVDENGGGKQGNKEREGEGRNVVGRKGRVVLSHMAKPSMGGVWHPGNIGGEGGVGGEEVGEVERKGKTEVEVEAEVDGEVGTDGKVKRDIRAWVDGIQRLARFENVVCKISGGFSELGAQHAIPIFPVQRTGAEYVAGATDRHEGGYEEERRAYREALERAAEHMGYFMDVIVDAFGWERVGWGSDWPVYAVVEEAERESR